MTAHDGDYAKHAIARASHTVILGRDELLDLAETLFELAHSDDPDAVALGVGAFDIHTGEDRAIVVFWRDDSQVAQDWISPHGDVSLN